MPVMEHELGHHKEPASACSSRCTACCTAYRNSSTASSATASTPAGSWSIGLVFCGVINILFGLSASVLSFGVLWTLNGWFQGMGFPPCARLMTHWFSPREFATKMAIWNSSHSLGAGLIFVLCGYLAPIDWRLCFLRAGGDRACSAPPAWRFSLRDTPESLGFPPVEGTADHQHDTEPLGSSLRRLGVQQSLYLAAVVGEFFCVRGAVRDPRLGPDVFEGGPRHRSFECHLDRRRVRRRRAAGHAVRAAGSPIACSAAGPRGPASST